MSERSSRFAQPAEFIKIVEQDDVEMSAVGAEATLPAGTLPGKKKALGRGLKGLMRSTE